MGIPLRILIIEDSEDDTLLVIRVLQKDGYDPSYERVETAEDMREALERETWDIIIADYTLPHFSGLDALKLYKEKGLDIPFIVVSGTIGEEIAVAAMLSGAHDYVMKNNLPRLFPAIQKALTEAESRRERKRAEYELQSARAFLDSVINAIADPVFVKDDKRRFVLVNEALCAIAGRPRESLIGKNDHEMFPEGEAAVLRKIDDIVLDTGKENVNEESLTNLSSGEVLTIVTSKTCYIDPVGKKFIVGVARDITDRKRAETYREMGREILQILIEPGSWQESIQRVLVALKTRTGVDAVGLRLQQGEDFPYFVQDGFSKNFLLTENTLLERGKDGGVCRDKDGNVRLECTCGLVICGKTDPSDPLFTQGGSCWTNDSFPLLDLPSDQDLRLHARNKCIHQGYASVALIPVRTSDQIVGLIQLNDKRKGHFTLETIEILEGIAAHIGSALMRKRAEEQLRISEEKYRNIFENMQDVYYETSLDGLILEISPSIEAISSGQYRQTDLIGQQMLDFYDDTQERERLITKLLETGSFSDFEILLRNRDGSLVPCSISAKLWRDDQGNPVKIIGSMRDTIERKKAEAEREKLQVQLLQAQKMELVGRLAGGVAHDYNNMLSVILGYTEMAMEQVDPDGPIYDNLKEVYTAGKRSIDITSQLLAFARKQIVRPIVMDLNETVDEMLKMLRRLIGEDIDFAWEPAIGLWPVKMDPSQIDQILANLCVNARDAISDIGKITIETQNVELDEQYCADHTGFVPGQFVMLAVSDNGCGMDKETREHIFEPFFTTKDIGKGTGLGLAMIYGIVKQNNGFVNVYSEPGIGTTFKIFLPRRSIETDEAITEVIHEEVVFGKGETLLLVEDEPAIIKMCQIMLKKLGYNVLIAHVPDEAVNLASEHSGIIHLLMSDVIMPGMNGRDLADKLKAIRPDIRVLFMSGYTANVIAHHGVQDEGEHFIQKPFSMKKLSVKVREALKGGKKS